MTNFTRTVLPNGLRVVTVNTNGSSLSATILVLVEAGSKYEVKENNGLSHFLEHMCFKGTLNRPTALAITAELDGIGAEYNAFTGQEYTGYYAKVRSADLDQALDIVADLYSNPVFNDEEIEKEKGVIIEEINMYEDLPPRKAPELFDELLYGDQPAGWPVGGHKEIILKLGKQDFLKYRSEHYVAQATAVIVVGSFNEADVIKKIEKEFANVPMLPKFEKVKTEDAQTTPKVKLSFKESDQTHLVLGCRAFSELDERRFALEVLDDVLGGGMSSRLFQVIREKMGAAYYVRSGESLYSDHGYWSVASGVDHKKVFLVIDAILKEMQDLKNTLVNDEELKRAKDHLCGQMVLGLETSDAKAMFYGGQEIIKKDVTDVAEYIQRIEAVTAEEVMRVARDVFNEETLNLVLIGPFKDEKVFLDHLRLN